MLLAKSDQTSLVEHTKDVIINTLEILKLFSPFRGLAQIYAKRFFIETGDRDQFSKFIEEFEEDLGVLSLVVAAFHDLGKAHPTFQLNLKPKKSDRSLAFDNAGTFEPLSIEDKTSDGLLASPHSILSAFLFDEVFLSEHISAPWIDNRRHGKDQKVKEVARLVRCAIAFHHWRDSIKHLCLLGEVGDILEDAKIVLDILWAEKFFDRLVAECNQSESVKKAQLDQVWGKFIKFLSHCNNLKPDSDHIKNLERAAVSGASLKEFITPPYSAYFLFERLGVQATELLEVLLGVLIWADHLASAKSETSNQIILHSERLKFSVCHQSNVGNNSDNEDKTWQGLLVKNLAELGYDFQKYDVVVLRAPTGIGKTYFAMKWLESVQAKSAIYTLPFCAAVEQAYQSFLYGIRGSDAKTQSREHKEKVQFFHGKLLLNFCDETYASSELEISKNQNFLKARQSLTKTMRAPVLVTTGHQIFPVSFGYPGYPKILVRCAGTHIIIDEVQVYSASALGALAHFVEKILRLGSKVLFISATIPDFFVSHLRKIVGQNKTVGPEPRNGLLEIDLYSLRVSEGGANELYFDFKSAELPANDRFNVLLGKSNDGLKSRHRLIYQRVGHKHIASLIHEAVEIERKNNAKEVRNICVVLNSVIAAQRFYKLLSSTHASDAAGLSAECLGSSNSGKNRKLSKKMSEDSAESMFRSILNSFGFKNPLIELIHSRFTSRDRQKKIIAITEALQRQESQSDEHDGLIVVCTQVLEVALDFDFDLMISAIAPLDCLFQRMGRLNRASKRPGPGLFVLVDPGDGGDLDGPFVEFFTSRVYDDSLLEITRKILSTFLEESDGGVLTEKEKADLLREYYKNLGESRFYQNFTAVNQLLQAGFITESKAEADLLFSDSDTIFVVPSKRPDDQEVAGSENVDDFKIDDIFDKLVVVPSFYQSKLEFAGDQVFKSLPKFIKKNLYLGGYYCTKLGWICQGDGSLDVKTTSTGKSVSKGKKKAKSSGEVSAATQEPEIDYLCI